VIKVYAVVLVVGFVALLAWILASVLAGNLRRESLDPDTRFGIVGRRMVAGAVGFGMAGMSAEYSPMDLPWPVALGMAAVATVAAAWYAGRVGVHGEEPA
jgi:hypothetical protein